jgi:N-acetylmuramoyl-L-alanine amidase
MIDVVFDVGHWPPPGDTGAVNSVLKITEYEWCYTFASACQWLARVKKLYSCCVVTRKTTLPDLCTEINNLNPRFVVSFHLNGFHDPYVSGTECFYWQTSESSRWAAQLIQAKMVIALGLSDRGAKPERLYQLGAVRAPIVLIEPGFLTCNGDINRMVERYQELIKAVTYGTREVLNYG